MFINWNDSFRKFRKPTLPNALPQNPPKMLGVVSQKYRPIGEKKYEERKKGIAKAHSLETCFLTLGFELSFWNYHF